MAAWELVSKDEVTSIHPIDTSVLEDWWSESVESMIREHLNMPNLGTSEVIVAEYHNGDGTNILLVRKPPILSVQELRIYTVSYIASNYVVFPNYLALKYETFPKGDLNIEIDYTSGQVEVPAQIKMTAAAMIAAILNYRARYGADSSFKWGSDLPMEAGENTPNLNVGLTSHLYQIMRRMLRRNSVRVS
jgi:hypothetical protein